MGHVQLHRVVAGLPGADRGGGVVADDARKIGGAQHVHGLPPAAAGDLEEVDDLQGQLAGARVMRPADQLVVPRDEAVFRQPQQRTAARMMHRRGLDDDQTGSAAGKTDIAVDDRWVDQAVLARQPGHHGGQDDPVGQDEAAQVEGREQPGKGRSRRRGGNPRRPISGDP